MYQAPLCASISRSTALRLCSTVRASARRAPIGGQRVEVGERPAESLGNDIEQRLGRRREEADIEVGVEEQRRDIGAVQDVLQIVGGGALPLQRFLELAVEGGQLLVERLQFLLRGQQLLVGRLEFLVDRQRFFVDRLLLFARDLEVADGALQLVLRGLELLLELGDPRERRRGAAGRPSRSCFVLRLVDEADQQQLFAVAQNRLDVDAERDRAAVAIDLAAGDDDRARCSWLACWIADLSLVRMSCAPWRADRASAGPAPRADSGRSVPRNRGTRACG